MKVKELIEALEKCDPEKMVVQTGHEGGYEEVECVSGIKLKLNANLSNRYLGPHERREDGECHAIQICI